VQEMRGSGTGIALFIHNRKSFIEIILKLRIGEIRDNNYVQFVKEKAYTRLKKKKPRHIDY
jgi:hypothetical protein